MRVSSAVFVSSALAILVAPRVFAADLVRPGLWENVTIMEAPNRPGKSPAQKTNHCYTAKELAGLNARDAATAADAFAGAGRDKCAVRDVRFAGDHVTWTTMCAGLTIHSDMTFHGDTLEAVLKMESPSEPMMTVHMTSRRLGDCQ